MINSCGCRAVRSASHRIAGLLITTEAMVAELLSIFQFPFLLLVRLGRAVEK
jgi:hypothetical protein